jgi:uncharacterized membrane protein
MFSDQDLKNLYNREKSEYYNKAVPVVAAMIALLAGTLEYLYRVREMGQISNYISGVNWITFLLFVIITVLHSRWTWMHTIICPCLTVLLFLYLTFMDYDFTMGSIYYS